MFGLGGCYAGLFDACVCLVAGFSAEFVVGMLLCFYCCLMFGGLSVINSVVVVCYCGVIWRFYLFGLLDAVGFG